MGCSRPAAIAVSAFLVATGLALIILAAALKSDFWIFFVLMPLAFLVLPMTLCTAGPDDSEETMREMCGNFFTGALVTSVIAIPPVLYHTGMVHLQAMFLAIAGSLCLFGTGVAFACYRARSDGLLSS